VILRQLGLAVMTLFLMGAASVTVPWTMFVFAYAGGHAVSRYDEGATR
jgi:hypothetical protein